MEEYRDPEIRDLPHNLRDLVYVRAYEQGKTPTQINDTTFLTSAFTWGNTPEGDKFWLYVNNYFFSKINDILDERFTNIDEIVGYFESANLSEEYIRLLLDEDEEEKNIIEKTLSEKFNILK